MATTHEKSTTQKVSWRIFCPRCLTVHEYLNHEGTERKTTRISCPECGKAYQVSTHIDGKGMPCCNATPVFIRGPELVENTHPLIPPR